MEKLNRKQYLERELIFVENKLLRKLFPEQRCKTIMHKRRIESELKQLAYEEEMRSIKEQWDRV